MLTAKTTIQARLLIKGERKQILDDLMRRWSSCMRFAYKRLLEGKTRNELKHIFYRRIFQSPQCESGTVSGETEGRNSGTAGHPGRRAFRNLWQVLRVAVLTALSPEGQKVPRCFSPLKPLMVSGEVGRIQKGREFLLLGAGAMGVQMPPAGSLDTLNRRGISNPAPKLCKTAQFG
ncbi:hypothetical protein HRbin19_00294 [bacterium HR19]|nr:hypothetical protein HRbin19_00294 [bacterium HR19]